MNRRSSQQSPPRKVAILYTGGTIGCERGPDGYAPKPGSLAASLRASPRFCDPNPPKPALTSLPYLTPPSQLGRRIAYDIFEYAPLLDSSSMEMEDWARIAKDIAARHDDFDAFVILHGTDTMAYTASALSFMLEGLRKTVIITGSQIPLSELLSDGIDNLLGALILAGHFTIPEVCLYFNHKLMRGNRCQKIRTDHMDAFASPNALPLAEVGTGFRVFSKRIWQPTNAENVAFSVQTKMEKGVAALRLFPGILPQHVANVASPPVRGLVLETFGSGNAPQNQPKLLRALQDAHKSGVVLVNCTQCLHGSVTSDYAAGAALRDMGVVPCGDMTTESALTKLSYLLAQDLSPEAVRHQMGQNLRGELSASW